MAPGSGEGHGGRVLLRALADLVAPGRCAGRRCPGPSPLCLDCARALAVEVRAGPTLALPTPCPPGLPPVWAVGDYAGVLREVLVAHKDRRRADLTPILAGLLRLALDAAPRGGVLVVVPSSPEARARRGGHPLTDVVRSCADRPLRSPLAWARAPADQAGLTAGARRANLAGSLVCTGTPDGGPVVLVDDVLTSGATLTEAARALRAAGVARERISAVVIAATRRRHGGPDGPGRSSR